MMTVPLMDLKAQYHDIKDDIDAAIQKTLDETSFIGGKDVQKFEEEFKLLTGPGHVITCANGTDSMEMILKAMHIGEGDEVIVPAHTWISTSEVVINSGATPVFADVAYDHCCLTISHIESKITPRTRAIIVVHLYGYPAPVDKIVAFASERGIKVIEDCAQAHGSGINSNFIGTFGDAASYSFYPGKNLGCYGDGGAVFTKDAQLATQIRMLSNHGQLEKHHHKIHGRNSRLDTLQARILSAKLPYLENWILEKNKLALLYHEQLKGVAEIELPAFVDSPDLHSWHLYVIKTKRRAELIEFLKQKGISTGIHYPKAIPFQSCYQDFNYSPDDIPNTFKLQSEVLSLPMYAELTPEQISYCTTSIKEFFTS